MNRRFDLQTVSRERSGLFGLAILWIMLFHSSLRFAWPPLRLIKATGYCGVDVFLFLSGVGLYFSMENDPSPRRFYKKRALRVLLPYAVVALLYEGGRCLLGQITPGELLANVTFVSYWRSGVQTYWFIAAVVLLYAVYPLLYRVIKGRHYVAELGLLALAFGMAWLLYQDQAAFYRVSGFVFRIPVFLLGCFAAPAVKAGKEVPAVPTAAGCLVVAAVCWYLWVGCDPWFFRMYLFIPLSISLVVLGSFVLSFLRKDGVIQRVLLFFGGMTLELYLVHEKLLAALRTVFPNHNLAVNGLAVLLAVGLALCLAKLCERLSP